jgi:hypothetical protein
MIDFRGYLDGMALAPPLTAICIQINHMSKEYEFERLGLP